MLNKIKNSMARLRWSLVFFCIRLILLFPTKLWRKIGQLLGLLLFAILGKRKLVIKKNIELCFPNMGREKQKELQVNNIRELGIGVLEFFVCCFKPAKFIMQQVDIVGVELLQQAAASKNGVIIFVPHTSSMCITISALAQVLPVSVLHRPFKHNALRSMLDRLACRMDIGLLAQRDIKSIIQTLKNNGNLVILPDHDMGRVGAIFADFFDIKAATTASIFKLAKSTGAEIISVYNYRLDDGKICIECSNELNNYCDSSHADAVTAMNKYLEVNVKRFPWQYYWPHKRFKTRPCDGKNLY